MNGPSDEELAARARQAITQRPRLIDDTVVVSEGVTCWLWGCILDDGTEAFVPWGEAHERRSLKGMTLGNGKKVDRAVKVDLVRQLRVRLPDGEVVDRIVSTGLASQMMAVGTRGS